MAGTKTSGRPGGNPELKKYQFKTDRPEPCNAKLSVRIPESRLAELQKLPGWRDLIRDKIEQILQENSP